MKIESESSTHCADCRGELHVSVRTCAACGLQLHAELPYPRLARLPAADRKLLEDFLLLAGNLSQLAREYGISRPTMRQRIDRVINTLHALRSEDARRSESLLTEIESGRLAPEAAARTLRELQS